VVSNVTIGRMRMQFWRDAIEQAFAGRPPREPVAILLEDVLRRMGGVGLTKGFFIKVIGARVRLSSVSAKESRG
jgi:NADH dehydrogenase [ubiquinone] 1 alpha subcomplex assembly factor 6